ncbi:ubiquitin-like-conjugating enzyme ATG10 isoform X2 [Boleophthalmus pectinirostris]|nr:ubiquitin-like-conjugating enzyme ATG10 isoform X2 [Boleophthalmus pectinirostris]
MSCVQLDEESFFQSCRRLLKKSDELRDGWSWETAQGAKEGYLRKTVLRSVVTGAKRNQKIEEEEFEQLQSSVAVLENTEEDEDEDEAAVVINRPEAEGGRRLCFQFEFHVVFSSSYGTPVLYFRAFTLEGKSLSLEDVWSFIRPKLRLTSPDALLSTVTQQEHPLLGQTFYMLHPCKTEDFMTPVLQQAQQENR